MRQWSFFLFLRPHLRDGSPINCHPGSSWSETGSCLNKIYSYSKNSPNKIKLSGTSVLPNTLLLWWWCWWWWLTPKSLTSKCINTLSFKRRLFFSFFLKFKWNKHASTVNWCTDVSRKTLMCQLLQSRPVLSKVVKPYVILCSDANRAFSQTLILRQLYYK